MLVILFKTSSFLSFFPTASATVGVVDVIVAVNNVIFLSFIFICEETASLLSVSFVELMIKT